ncbi:hypothetical protein [Thermofilum sp.]|uniref:hypothetical protein n=1 Tax=Thermofilum sp. TaxID=1961369 RepID=UPI003162DA94
MQRLVYEYSEGYVVDAETGEVVDRIYDYSPPRPRSDDSAVAENKKRVRVPGKGLGKLIKAYRRLVEYEKQGYIVDYEKALSNRMIKTLKHERSMKAEKYFAEKGLLDKLSKIVEDLDARGVTSGMSFRGRLAFAYIVYKLARGETPKYSDVRGIVSESTFRRIRSKARCFIQHAVEQP